MTKRRIIIIGGGLLQTPAIEIAKDMGLYTIVFDMNKETYGMKIADFPVVVSTRDVEGAVRMARDLSLKMKVDGVITVGTDASTTVAAVANALGVPGNRFEDAYAATNKIRMRERFKLNNVPQPNFYPAWSYDKALSAFHKLNKPVVVKPADNMGSRGVMKITNEKDMLYGFNRAKSASPSGEVIIEEFMDGPELSIDMLIYEDNIYVTGVADRIIEFPPYFIETGHIMPSALEESEINDAINVMKKGIKALGLSIGAAKGDIKVTKNGAMVGEIAARLSGGFMSAYTYPLSSGVNLIKNAIEIALGDKPSDLKPKWDKVAVEKAFLPGVGIIDSIQGIEKAKSIDGVKEIFIKTKAGDLLIAPTNNLEKAGNVIAVADTRDEAIKIANEAISTIHFNIKSEASITVDEIKKTASEMLKLNTGLYEELSNTDIDSITALNKYRFSHSLIHESVNINTNTMLFGCHISQPIIIDTVSNLSEALNGVMSIKDYYKSIIEASDESEVISIFRDFECDDNLNMVLDIIKDTQRGILMFSAALSQDALIKKLKLAEENGALAVGIDLIDSKNNFHTKSETELKALVKAVNIPFVLSGITSENDLRIAAKIGINSVYIKNNIRFLLRRGESISDTLTRVSLFLKKNSKSDINILVESSFLGEDALAYLALGANAVCITNDIFMACVAKGRKGVQYMLNYNQKHFMDSMNILGASSLNDIKSNLILK